MDGFIVGTTKRLVVTKTQKNLKEENHVPHVTQTRH